MKTNKFLTLILSLVAIIAITSCVEDDDFGTPIVNTTPVDLSGFGTKTTFAAVIARYDDAVLDGDQIGVFNENDEDLYIEGYVISSDRVGNFFEEIIIQNSTDENDAGTDPRRGLKVEINVSNLYNIYGFGRKIYIKLNGLAIGVENGVFTLGRSQGNSLEQIEEYELLDFIARDNEIATMIPKVLDPSQLTEMDENTLIQFDNMQINRTQLGLTYAGEATDQFDGFRTLENCTTNATIALQTSTFADFKSAPVAQYRGSIQGIFSRDFGDDFNVFIINSTDDVNFTNMERCDPIELDCGIAAAEGSMNLFNDDFESQSTGSLISGNGWTNYIQAGTRGWTAYTDGAPNPSLGKSAEMGAFRSSEDSNIAWLITPAVDFDAQDGETFVFKTSNSFSDNSTLELLFSTDWDGTEENIVTANWGVLPAAYIVDDADFFGDWFDSGIVDLSCAEGMMYIAFKYTGGDQNDFTGTYELDEISIDYTP